MNKLLCGGVLCLCTLISGCNFEHLDFFKPKTESRGVRQSPPVTAGGLLSKNSDHQLYASEFEIEGGVKSAYIGPLWLLPQPKVGWVSEDISDALVHNGGKITVFTKTFATGVVINLLGVQQLELDKPFGISSKNELEKCIDSGLRTRVLKLYHIEKPVDNELKGRVIASGFDCGFEQIQNGNAKLKKSDKDNFRNTDYESYELAAMLAEQKNKGIWQFDNNDASLQATKKQDPVMKGLAEKYRKNASTPAKNSVSVVEKTQIVPHDKSTSEMEQDENIIEPSGQSESNEPADEDMEVHSEQSPLVTNESD